MRASCAQVRHFKATDVRCTGVIYRVCSNRTCKRNDVAKRVKFVLTQVCLTGYTEIQLYQSGIREPHPRYQRRNLRRRQAPLSDMKELKQGWACQQSRAGVGIDAANTGHYTAVGTVSCQAHVPYKHRATPYGPRRYVKCAKGGKCWHVRKRTDMRRLRGHLRCHLALRCSTPGMRPSRICMPHEPAPHSAPLCRDGKRKQKNAANNVAGDRIRVARSEPTCASKEVKQKTKLALVRMRVIRAFLYYY